MSNRAGLVAEKPINDGEKIGKFTGEANREVDLTSVNWYFFQYQFKVFKEII